MYRFCNYRSLLLVAVFNRTSIEIRSFDIILWQNCIQFLIIAKWPISLCIALKLQQNPRYFGNERSTLFVTINFNCNQINRISNVHAEGRKFSHLFYYINGKIRRMKLKFTYLSVAKREFSLANCSAI